MRDVCVSLCKFACVHRLTGHEDWIRDLDVCQISDTQLLIASCSQDYYLRIWKVDSQQLDSSPEDDASSAIKSLSLTSDTLTSKVAVLDQEIELASSLFTLTSDIAAASSFQYSIKLESVLYGHEDWIYSVKFHPRTAANEQPLILLSASMDKTLVLWTYDGENSIWVDTVRMRYLVVAFCFK